MKTRKILALVLSLVMVLGLCGTAFAAPHTSDEVTELESTNSDLAEKLAEQTYVLLENNGVLPIAKSGAIAIFGSAAETTIKGGTGSGDVNQRAHDNIGDAFVAAGYSIANPTWFQKMADTPQPSSCLGTSPKPDIEITDEELAEAVENTDTAIYAIARNAGEGSDRYVDSGDGSFVLTELELANITKICGAFDKVIVVYNTLVMDASWQKTLPIDAVVFMCNGGQRGSEALVNVLNGTVTPSGKLTDTWALKYSDYPSAEGFSHNDGNTNTEWYSEGIYMGYRYFDTFGKDVMYPFGYGLSYTTFGIEVKDVAADAEKVTVTVDVTNTGDRYSGKEVVQVYFSAPDGELDKPYQELAAYGKTDELAPGDKQTLTISFATTDMSSYSEARASYIMDKGDYIIRVGNCSRNTVAAAVITLDELAVTEIMVNQLALEEGATLDELKKDGATPIANNDEAELEGAKKIALKAEDIVAVDYRANINDAETITTYLFAEDADAYKTRDAITLQTKTVAGIIANNEGNGGYSTTTYKEVKEIVDPLPEGITKETAKLDDVLSGKITLKQFVACLSAYELARLCVGGAEGATATEGNEMVGAQASAVRGGAGQSTDAFYYTRHIPAMPNSDGPAGIRITQQYSEDGQNYYQFCTAFPVGTNIAQSWDTALYEAFGKAVGSEMVEYNVTTWLAPGMDMHRDPLCGRNFEYYSEDPLVAGLTAAYATMGVQSHSGIGVTLKHFWGNEQEDNRNALDNVIGERAARELYLKQFEIAVRLAQPQCIMNCYNENNGWPGSDSWDVNEDILRGEWGFTGYVMTDWGGGQSTDFIAKHGGCDMVMPGGNATTILTGYIYQEPTFAKSGAVDQLGIFTPAADGDTTYTVSAVIPGTPGNAWMGIPDGPDAPVESIEDLPASVQEAIEAGYVTANINGWDTTLTWRGNIDKDKFMEDVNRICLGDLQKSAMRILQVDLLSQDMEKMMAELDKEYTAGSYSANYDAPLATGYAPVEKGEVSNVGIVAEKVTADAKVDETVSANVVYNGDAELTTVRLTVKCAVAIESVEALGGNSIEFNPANGKVIVYAADGTAVANELFKINFKIDKWYPDGEYPIDLTLIEATDSDVEDVDVVVADGAIIFDNTPLKGDIDGDGIICNKDLILIARYIVRLIDFNEKQKIAADYDENGTINNADLILIARYIVGDCPPAI